MSATLPGLRIITAAHLHSLSAHAGNALLMRGGSIEQVGALDELRAAFPQAEVLDYSAATITPGLTDAHIHITEWAIARREADLAAAQTIDDAVRLIGASTGATRGDWVMGRGWNPHHWGGGYPGRTALDRVIADRPAAYQSHDMHALWVNSRALEVAGIDADTPDPPGGRIERDESGQPTGTLLENAALLVMNHVPPPSDEHAVDAVAAAQSALHAFGITGIHSFPGFQMIEPLPLRVLQTLRENGRLRLRVLQHIALDQLDDAIHLGLRSGFGDDWLRIGALKMFLDGALGSRTAWMRRPYENAMDCGVRVLPEADFRAAVERAALAGIAATVHAIGDAAVTLAFDVLTAPNAQSGVLPNRIEHVQCCPPDRMSYAARAGIVCSMQPCHLISDWRAANQHWGAERAATTYAFRSLLERGATLAFGSDAPVEPVDPRLGFFAATERLDLEGLPAEGWVAHERITMLEVLKGYTLGPAVAAGTTGRQGCLAPGAAADLVVWDQDPLQVAGRDLLSLKVRATFVGGELVYHE